MLISRIFGNLYCTIMNYFCYYHVRTYIWTQRWVIEYLVKLLKHISTLKYFLPCFFSCDNRTEFFLKINNRQQKVFNLENALLGKPIFPLFLSFFPSNIHSLAHFEHFFPTFSDTFPAKNIRNQLLWLKTEL